MRRRRVRRLVDHVIVVDLERQRSAERTVVACYRLLRQKPAHRAGGFYTEREFDLTGVTMPGRRLELGRSCIAAGFRSGTVM